MMNRWLGAYAILGCIAAVGSTTKAASLSQSSNAVDHIVVTGCLELAPPHPTGTTGSDAASDDTSFLLTHALPSRPGLEGTAGSASPSSRTGKTFRLEAATVALMPHLGHRVEIAGTVQNEPSVKASIISSDSGSALPDAKLTVESIQMVTATCTDVLARK